MPSEPSTGRVPAAAVAWLVYLATVPAAFAAPALLDLDPFEPRAPGLLLNVCVVAAAALAVVALRRRGPAFIAVVAGLLSSYLVLVMRTALHGTPFGYGGVHGDTGRITAMAVHYEHSWATHDGIVGTASEYPPLFPFLVGKAAMLADVPAWRLLGHAEILLVSASIVAGFALWSRLVSPVVALAASVAVPFVFGVPSKPHEVLALAVFLPLVLLTVARPPGERLHWLPAGVIAGALCLTYHAWVVFSALGLLALAWWTWRREPDRRAYLLYVGRIVAVMAAVTAWYTVPYVSAMLTGGQQVGDTFHSARISENPFPFLKLGLTGLLCLAGLVGLLRYARTAWWAPPLLAVLAGSYAYRAIGMVRWETTGRSGLYYYTAPLIELCLIVGLVLSVATIAPRLSERMSPAVAARSGVLGMTAVVFFVAAGSTVSWMPVTRVGTNANGALAALAHHQRLPGGGLPAGRPGPGTGDPSTGDPEALAASVGIVDWDFLPVAAMERQVRTVRPADRYPHVLSHDEQIHAFLPWRGFIGVDRTGAQGPTRYDDRHRELVRLSRLSDPVAFANATRRTRFGPIDVFVLRRGTDGTLVWKGLRVPEAVRFQRGQFAPAAFHVVNLEPDVFLAVRRP
ncbi:arabinofuranosyltransferase [Actinomadura sp. 9N407]|uniref:arabinofuranosyltransferase n=1 Tax=Actinomadura sp. 9N407 TaxID=3375154 RepID=UPI003798946F